MFSKLAKTDIELLRQQGFTPTDDEIIELNDLAVKIEIGKDQTVVSAPRVCTVGNVTLYEPTIGSDIWWHEIGKNATENQTMLMFIHFFSLAHARNMELLSQLDKPKEILKVVKKWMRNLDISEAELWIATLYVKRLYDTEGNVDDMLDDKDYMDYLYSNLILCAGQIGVKPEELYTQTHSSLYSLIVSANLHAKSSFKKSVASLYIKYKRIIRTIEDRGAVNGQQA